MSTSLPSEPEGARPEPPGAGAPPFARPSLVAATATTTAFTALAMLVSVVNQAIAAALFGAGEDYDFYRAASVLPNLLMLVLMTTLPAVLVPAFIRCEINRSLGEAWALASRCLAGVAIAASGLTLALIVLAPWLIGAGVLTSGAAFAPPGRGFTLTTLMLRIQLPNILFAGVASVLTGLHLARRSFARPAAAPVIQTGAMLAAIVLLYRPLGILALAVGSVLGPLAQMLFLLSVLRGGFRPRLDLGHPELRRLALALVPLMAAAVISKGADLVETRVASGLATGSLAIIGFAGIICDRASNLVSQGVALTSLPDLSRHAASGDAPAFRARFSLAIRFTLLIAIPAVVGLIVLREPLIALLLQRGRFSAADTQAVGLTLVGFLGVLLATTAGRAVTSGLHAHQRQRVIAWIGIGGTLIYVPLAVSLPPRFDPPVVGLAVAWSITNLVDMAIAAWALRRLSGPLDGSRITRAGLRMAAAAGIMGLAVYAGNRWVAEGILALADPLRSLALVAELAILGALGFWLYAAVLKRLGSSEVAGLAAAIGRLAAAFGRWTTELGRSRG